MLSNPPGPRVPTSLNNSFINNSGQKKVSAINNESQSNRKRKPASAQDGHPPAKVKPTSGITRTPATPSKLLNIKNIIWSYLSYVPLT